MIKRAARRFWQALTAVAVFVALAGSAACNSTPANVPAKGGDLDIIKSAMSYIGQHHPEAAAFIKADASYAQTGSSGKGMQGYSSITYTGDGWTISVGHAVVPDYINDITADYGSGKITWTGTEKNGLVTEVSYTKTG